MIDYIIQKNLGDFASLISLIISIIGFGIITYNVIKTRRLSVQVREDILRSDTVLDFSSAISFMEEIKLLHRKQAWEILPERYSSLRKTLISIKESNPDISDEYKRRIQSTISILSNIENEIEQINFNKSSPPDIPKLNLTISRHIDRLQPILIEIRNQIGR